MKLRVFDRILLALLLIVTIVASFALLGVACNLIPQSMVNGFFYLFYANTTNRWILAGAALLVLIISIRLVFAGKSDRQAEDPAAVMQAGELGSTFVSLSALDGMVKKHCSAYERICACRSTLKSGSDGLSISLKLAVLPDTNVSLMTGELQRTLKEYIQGLTGIEVKEIRIMVEEATEAQIKARPAPTSNAFTMPTVKPNPQAAENTQTIPAQPIPTAADAEQAATTVPTQE